MHSGSWEYVILRAQENFILKTIKISNNAIIFTLHPFSLSVRAVALKVQTAQLHICGDYWSSRTMQLKKMELYL